MLASLTDTFRTVVENECLSGAMGILFIELRWVYFSFFSFRKGDLAFILFPGPGDNAVMIH